jgi:hypothetical protein
MADFIHLSDGGVNLANVIAYTIGENESVTLLYGKDHYRSFHGKDAELLLDALGRAADQRTVVKSPVTWGGPVMAGR